MLDVDGDGKKDMAVGTQDRVKYYLNTGTDASPAWGAGAYFKIEATSADITLPPCSHGKLPPGATGRTCCNVMPFFADYDNDGNTDLVAGFNLAHGGWSLNSGELWLFRNSAGGTVEEARPFPGSRQAEAEAKGMISVRPNPFHASVAISVYDGHVGATRRVTPTLAIYDIHGRMVHASAKWDGNRLTWNPGRLPAGVYTARVTLGNRVHSTRLILLK
jgi:hypothetical protein